MPDLPASNRLRIGRYAESSRIYLLTTNTHDREPDIQRLLLGRGVVNQFRCAQDQGFANSLAWVVMPDHFHWLIELQQGSLGGLMQRTKSLDYQGGEASLPVVRQSLAAEAFMIERCVEKRIWSKWLGMSWLTRCGRVGREAWRLSVVGCYLGLIETESPPSRAGSLPQGICVSDSMIQLWEPACSR